MSENVLTRCAVVIPVYNNCRTLRDVVSRAVKQHCAVVAVVDDGSTDCDVAAEVAALPVTLLRNETNMGKGAALKKALNYLKENHPECYWMITLDADGQHYPEDIVNFVPYLENHRDSILVGCRDFDTPNVPERSRKGREIANFWMRLESGKKVGDCQSGFRAYPVEYVSKLRCVAKSYEWETEIIVRAAWAGLDFCDVPVRVKYFTAEERVSHFQPLRDNLLISLIHARLTCESLIPLPRRKLVKRSSGFSIFRPKELFLHLLRENNSASGLATAAAVGTFIAVLPLFALHTATIIFVTVRLHLNKVMAVAIQNLFMPPISPFLCIELGYYMRHGEFLTEFTMQTAAKELHLRAYEWLLGSLVLAPFWSVVIWGITYVTVKIIRRMLKFSKNKSDEVMS